MKPFRIWAAALAICVAPASAQVDSGAQKSPAIYSGIYENGAFSPLTFVNGVAGWETFFQAGFLGQGRIIANVEAGLVWDGHEAFNRPPGSPSPVALTLSGTGALSETDFHATMVGHVLAGTGYVEGTDPPQYTYAGIGMAPMAQLWSGAIATAYSPSDVGGFNVTTESAVSVYRPFFQGIAGQRPDVINSSWGGPDPQAVDPVSLAIDGLAAQNATVAFVAAAGNEGAGAVSAPGATFNGITVGALGGSGFLTPSTFSSQGAVDFYNPVTDTVLPGVRAAVDIAAAGENLVLAAYLGDSGGVGASTDPGIVDIIQDPAPQDLYFLNQSGTSFAAPLVAGSIALLKEVAATHPTLNLLGVAPANDTRVMRSILMAGATETSGWNNGQADNGNGVITTTQAVDFAVGAGALNLNNTVDIYFLAGTRDLAGSAGGTIDGAGWDFASLALAGTNDYLFENPFSEPVELTISLNWFAGRTFDNLLDAGSETHFSNLDLEVWEVVGGVFSTLVAQSTTTYNNTEFLRLDLAAGDYGIRVRLDSLVYEVTPGGFTEESYALAWRAIPEPSSFVLIAISAAGLLTLRLRRRG